jgi:hypothetical protein
MGRFANAANYLDNGQTGLTTGILPVTINIEDMKLLYETIQFEAGITVFRASSSFRYHYDTHHTAISTLVSGQRFCINTFILPKNTKLVFIAFLFQYQLYLDEGKKKNLEYVFRFPADLRKLTVKIDGEPIIWPQGLSDFCSQGSWSASLDSALLYDYLRLRRWVDVPFGEFYPSDPSHIPWKHALPLDLTPYNIRQNANLTVHTEYNDTLSPSNMYAVAQALYEKAIIHGADGK